MLAKEKMEQARQAFQTEEGEPVSEDDLSWISRLTHDGNGKIEKTINNAVLILQNDPLLKGKIVTDEFASCGLILGKVPWSAGEEKRRWKMKMMRASIIIWNCLRDYRQREAG